MKFATDEHGDPVGHLRRGGRVVALSVRDRQVRVSEGGTVVDDEAVRLLEALGSAPAWVGEARRLQRVLEALPEVHPAALLDVALAPPRRRKQMREDFEPGGESVPWRILALQTMYPQEWVDEATLSTTALLDIVAEGSQARRLLSRPDLPDAVVRALHDALPERRADLLSGRPHDAALAETMANSTRVDDRVAAAQHSSDVLSEATITRLAGDPSEKVARAVAEYATEVSAEGVIALLRHPRTIVAFVAGSAGLLNPQQVRTMAKLCADDMSSLPRNVVTVPANSAYRNRRKHGMSPAEVKKRWSEEARTLLAATNAR